MKTNCEPFLTEIAACAWDAAELSTEAAAHVANCVRCQEKVAEFKRITAMHWEAASALAEPMLRLGREQLEGAMAGDGGSRSDFQIQWRPVLAAVLTLALIVGTTLIYWSWRETPDARPQAKQLPSEIKPANGALEPTLWSLRYGVESGREPLLAGATGPGMRHYRLKDAEREP